MKAAFFIICLCLMTVMGHGQPTAGQTTTDKPYAVVNRDANSRVWERATYETLPSGRVVTNLHHYTELATGLNHLVNGQWVESKEEIDLLANGGAAATNGQHQVYFPGDIYAGQIEMVTPDGRHLKSRPLGLSYFDGTNSVLIGQLTNSMGYLAGSNQVIYPDAFMDLKADLRYTYTKAGFEQDIILREQPLTPESYGLDPDTSRLEVLTEFFDPPQPAVTANTVPTAAGDVENDDLDFGTMAMVPGKAFLMGTNSPAVSVNKQWLNLEGRTFLVEEVPVDAIVEDLLALPEPAGTSARLNRHSPLGMVSARRLLPTRRMATVPGKHPMQLAHATPASHGLVLDYVTLNSTMTNVTFQGDTTYYISGTVNLYGTNTFEGGTVLKYATNASITVNISYFGSPTNLYLNWLTSAYRPVIFTARDDNSVGETISGSTGNPNGYYANPALNIDVPWSTTMPTPSYFRISYAKQALSLQGSFTIQHGQIVNCQNGIQNNNAGIFLRNLLFANVQTNLNPVLYANTLNIQNCTFSSSSNLINAQDSSSQSVTANLTNCILVNVGNLTNAHTFSFTYQVNGANNGFYNSPVFGTGQTTNTSYPFQTVGGGSYYLTNGCSFFNAGTTNIDPTLLAQLQQKTTWPPIVYSNVTISVNTTFSPQAQRDADTPDLGYHYDPLDYAFGGCTANSNIIFTAGTAVGWFELPGSYGSGYGISLGNGIQATFNSTATSLCHFVKYDTVQEGNGQWTDDSYPGGIVGGFSYIPYDPSLLTAQFTHFSHLAAENGHFRDGASGESLKVQATDCEMWGFFGGYNILGAFTNCLIMGGFSQETGVSQYTNEIYREVFRNCTFHNGTLQAVHSESPPYWQSAIYDCAFDGIGMNVGTNGLVCDYNAFLTNATRLPIHGAHDVIMTNSYNWQSSWFGNYYQPTNSLLIDKGNTTADQVGLYHFTTQTNQTVEANSIVDIGYHYVATDANGNPLDSNGNGIPDYLEDANGNGLDDPGETPWNFSVSGLQLWLRADAGVTNTAGAISVWSDQSGNANNAAQSTGGNQPSYVTNVINGYPVVRFDGINDQLMLAASPAATNFTVYAVVKATQTETINVEDNSTTTGAGSTGQHYLFGGNYDLGYDAAEESLSLGTNGVSVYEFMHNHSGGDEAAPLAVYNANIGSGFSIVAMKFASLQPSIYLNGGLMRIGLPSLRSPLVMSTPIGNGFPSGSAFGGDVAEIMIFDRALTDDEQWAVATYLNGKYAMVPYVPQTPINLNALTVSSNQVDLTWINPATNALNFQVERKQGVGGTYQNIATVAAPAITYLDTGLTAGTTYYYRIRADNLAGTSAYSNETNATTSASASELPLPDLKLWLAADAGLIQSGTGQVNRWIDQSGNTNDAVQNDSSSQPLFVTNVINGRPAIQFDGTNDQLMMAVSPGTNNFTVFAVVNTSQGEEIDSENNSTNAVGGFSGEHYLFGGIFNHNDYGEAGLSLGTNGISAYEYAYNTFGSNQWGAQAVYSGNVGSGFSVVEMSYDDQVPSIYLNGELTHVGIPSSRPQSVMSRAIGYGNADSVQEPFSGNVAEILIFNRRLASPEQDTVVNYLMSKYSLAQYAVNTSAPIAPTNLVATAIAPYYLHLQWISTSTNAGGFQIESKLGTGGAYAKIGAVLPDTASLDVMISPTNSYFYRVKAYNFFGSNYSAEISPPTVSLTNLPSAFVQNTTNLIGAQAADADGTVTNVKFFSYNVLMATLTSAPYTNSWIPTMEGSWILTALATDNQGNSQYSPPITVTVYLDSNGDGIPDYLQVLQGNNPINPWIPPAGDTNTTPPNINLVIPANATLLP